MGWRSCAELPVGEERRPRPMWGLGEPEVIDTIAVSSLTHSHFHTIKSAFRNVSLKGK